MKSIHVLLTVLSIIAISFTSFFIGCGSPTPSAPAAPTPVPWSIVKYEVICSTGVISNNIQYETTLACCPGSTLSSTSGPVSSPWTYSESSRPGCYQSLSASYCCLAGVTLTANIYKDGVLIASDQKITSGGTPSVIANAVTCF